MPSLARILIVEDDSMMAKALSRQLKRAGYQVATVTGAADFWHLYRKHGADLVLLDLNLGEEDGMDLTRDLVRSTSAGVIMVTARDSLQDRIAGLESGADDYIVKPFEPDELLARVRAVLRRHPTALPLQPKFELGPYLLDCDTLTVHSRETGQSVRLTEAETRILMTLMQHSGRVVMRQQLLGHEFPRSDNRVVAVHIANIRRKLRGAGMDSLVIWPVRGAGYRVRVESSEGQASEARESVVA
jgi:DNA-binding response OmpR family regulator